MDHDQRFKTLIRVFLAEFMDLFFHDWLDLLDLSEIVWLEQEISTEPPTGPRQVLDLAARIRTRQPLSPWHDNSNGECLLAILIEIESPDSTTSIRDRMPGYAARLSGKLELPVLPIVLFLNVGLDGVGVLTHERKIRDLVVERSDFLYVGLPALNALQYVEGNNWLGVALSALMRIPPDRVAWLGAEALRRLGRSSLDDQRKFLLGECVRAYLPLTEDQQRELDGLLQTETYSEVKAVNVTIYEKGIMKGELKGLVSGLLFATELKFGRVDPAVSDKINALSTVEQVRAVQSLLRTTVSAEEFLRDLGSI
ncbi:RpnC/YadD family protein [Zavarzinella formosa]|uniref:hypothetical protein n=1 Tax=Zavarzinella formosa TaxID=360055 RepID=UPI0002FE16C9|nr:hypothetical protein [Zavarzinella formosa]